MDVYPNETNGHRSRSQPIPQLLVFSEDNFTLLIDKVKTAADPGDKADAKGAFLRLCSSEWTNSGAAAVGEAVLAPSKKMGAFSSAVASHNFGDVSAFHAADILFKDAMMIRAHSYRGELGATCPLAANGCISLSKSMQA
ncbi:MAG: hypothetical protein PVI89_09570 [Desulfobacteraceae bacterium]|jgi:hypothetical protein